MSCVSFIVKWLNYWITHLSHVRFCWECLGMSNLQLSLQLLIKDSRVLKPPPLVGRSVQSAFAACGLSGGACFQTGGDDHVAIAPLTGYHGWNALRCFWSWHQLNVKREQYVQIPIFRIQPLVVTCCLWSPQISQGMKSSTPGVPHDSLIVLVEWLVPFPLQLSPSPGPIARPRRTRDFPSRVLPNQLTAELPGLLLLKL